MHTVALLDLTINFKTHTTNLECLSMVHFPGMVRLVTHAQAQVFMQRAKRGHNLIYVVYII